MLPPTPLVPLGDTGVWIKDERAQPTGSFKVRGAMRWVDCNPGDAPVVTASSGNHARALYWALSNARDTRRLIVVVTDDADPNKVATLHRSGCEVVETPAGPERAAGRKTGHSHDRAMSGRANRRHALTMTLT